MSLRDLLIESAHRWPSALAIQDSKHHLTYQELDTLADAFAVALAQRGVQRGDRVGIWLEKSAGAVAAMQGVLRLNAAYVPLDPLSPTARIQTILNDCGIQVLVTTTQRASLLQSFSSNAHLDYLQLEGHTDIASEKALQPFLGKSLSMAPAEDDELAYILYTSGSTGVPKGVCISNLNALAFISWAADTIQATTTDRFANHAPLHFDLSVLDLYAAFTVGAAVLLIPESIAYLPGPLVEFVRREKPTVWYSVPSAIILMMEQGELLDLEDVSWRIVLFAGEPFPLKHLRRLYRYCPQARLFNLYGPTETNVCTFCEVTEEHLSRTDSMPIGRASSSDRVWIQKADGTCAQPGEEGELLVSGPTVMLGYWGQRVQGTTPYATGDLVRLLPDGNYLYLGRVDQMVKIRGYRVEPGDIESTLLEHPAIQEAAVLVIGQGIEARLTAFVVCTGEEVPSLLELKRHCAQHLPRYMIIDAVRVLPRLPRTRNGKIDRLALSASNSNTH